GQAERHVAAQVGADAEEFLPRGAGAPQRVAGQQRARAVRAAARHAAGDGDVLGDVQVHVGRAAVALGEGDGGPGGEVGAVQGDLAGVRARARHPGAAGRRGGGDLVVQADGEEDVGQVVEAVGAGGADRELDVDLGGDADRDAGAHAPDSLLGACSAMRANSSTVSDSPRACGDTPAATRAASAAAAEPAHPASAARRVLRRCAKAASTTAKTSRRVAVVLGGSARRTRETRPLSTLGAGQKTVRPIAPARLTSAYQLALTEGTPYTFEPGAAASRSATSDWTMTRVRSMLGNVSSMCSSTGTATLAGRLATSAVGGGPGSPVTGIASEWTSANRSARSGMRASTVAGSAAARTSSISTAVTRSAASSSARVSEPSPGPTSTTTSSGRTSAVRTIRRTVFASMTKFWPRCLVGRTPRAAASSRTSAGPRRASGVGLVTGQGYGAGGPPGSPLGRSPRGTRRAAAARHPCSLPPQCGQGLVPLRA